MGTFDIFSETAETAKSSAIPADPPGLLPGEDFFATQGYRELCVALLKEAARDLAEGPDQPDAQETTEWLNGADSPIPFAMCLAALGIDEWEDAVREAIISRPRDVTRSLTSFFQTSTWGQKISVAASLAEDAAVMASYRQNSRSRG